jgi:hypothetical protein
MKVVELKKDPPTVDQLLGAAQSEDVVVLRDGKPWAKVEKFDEGDWEDYKFEHSPAALDRGRLGREQYARGDYATLGEVKKRYGLD